MSIILGSIEELIWHIVWFPTQKNAKGNQKNILGSPKNSTQLFRWEPLHPNKSWPHRNLGTKKYYYQ